MSEPNEPGLGVALTIAVRRVEPNKHERRAIVVASDECLFIDSMACGQRKAFSFESSWCFIRRHHSTPHCLTCSKRGVDVQERGAGCKHHAW